MALDVTLTDELRREGVARELVNRLQNLRKDSGPGSAGQNPHHAGGRSLIWRPPCSFRRHTSNRKPRRFRSLQSELTAA
ncbi:MAG: DUF5915 domain-containing protein [Hymenobacter sp.]